MMDYQLGYVDGCDAAHARAYRIAPRGSASYQQGWRAGFDDECRANGWVSVSVCDGLVAVRYGRASVASLQLPV